MSDVFSRDRADLAALLEAVKVAATEFLTGLDERPVAASPAPPAPLDLPDAGVGAQAALALFRRRFEAGMSGSPGPRYAGFVTGGTTPAALAGDWLTAVYDQNALWSGDTIAPWIEVEALHMLKSLLGLDPAYCGVFVTGATVSNAVGLAVARQWLGRRHGVDVAHEGVHAMPPVKVLAGAAHSSIGKALAMIGLGRAALEPLPCLPGREAADIAALRVRLEALRGQPIVVIASAGTVNTADFDDLRQLAALKQEYEFWLHVDGAFGLFAGASPRYADLVAGIDAADSITVDAHKWLNVPYDGAMLLTRHIAQQVEVFKNESAYLGMPHIDPLNFLHLGPENSRRLRALPAWMTLIAYGRHGHRALIEHHAELARELGDRLIQSGFELLAPVRLNVVCFSFRQNGLPADRKAVEQVLAAAHESGDVFVTPTVYADRAGIRAALVNWRTQATDIERMVAALASALAAAGQRGPQADSSAEPQS